MFLKMKFCEVAAAARFAYSLSVIRESDERRYMLLPLIPAFMYILDALFFR